MRPFRYATAYSAERAVDLVSGNGRFFAGGIDVLGELKDGIAAPDILVNVKELPETREIVQEDGVWKIGANVTLTEIVHNRVIGARFPGLMQAAEEVGSPQIRNVATIGGNLAQHSRCWYYRHPDVTCLKNGGATCYAREGQNKYHSLFSGNPCISPVVSNLAIMLAALDARVLVFRSNQNQKIGIPELYQMAWYNPLAHNSLQPSDLILGVEIPEQANASAYLQLSEKSSFDWALVSCAAAARVDNGRLQNPRVFLGVVAPIPYQNESAHQLLDGNTLTAELAAEAADVILDGAVPMTDNGYKIPLAKALVQRTLMQLVS